MCDKEDFQVIIELLSEVVALTLLRERFSSIRGEKQRPLVVRMDSTSSVEYKNYTLAQDHCKAINCSQK